MLKEIYGKQMYVGMLLKFLSEVKVSEPIIVVVPDISVAYVVVAVVVVVGVVVVVVVVVVVISLGTMVQFPVQHSSQEVKTQLAELATSRGGQSSWTFKKKMEEK